MKIKLPKTFMGKPIEGAMERALAEADKKEKQEVQPVFTPTPATDLQSPENYIILPSHNHESYSYPDTLVAMERSHLNKNWNEAHQELANNKEYMLTIRQFIDFLNLLRSGNAYDGRGRKVDSGKLSDIFKDVTEVRNPWRAEWLDADFKKVRGMLGIGGQLKINYEHRINTNRGLIPKCPAVLAPCLMKDKKPGIDLTDWLDNANYQGLPKENVKSGALYYWCPGSDNNSVARFSANSIRTGLDCDGDPTLRNDGLGVRSAREKN